MFGQTFEPHDLAIVALLIVLEGVLSIDNALVLGLLARKLPRSQQKRALTYGLAGAFLFRFLAIGTAAYLLQWRVVKLVGGGYLLWVFLKHFYQNRKGEPQDQVRTVDGGSPILTNSGTGRELTPEEAEAQVEVRTTLPLFTMPVAGFWSTVAVIEMTDIAFAIDSILAAIALVGSAPAGTMGPHPKLWVVITGGMLGVILMRFAAILFIRMLEKWPRFETSAYLLVGVIGSKLIADWGLNTPRHPHMADFHSPSSAAFWVFWLIMLACFSFGFLPRRLGALSAHDPESTGQSPAT
jgi:YkoY family integral membrane protein